MRATESENSLSGRENSLIKLWTYTNRKESSTSTIPCIPDVGKPLSKDVKPREDESSRLSSIFNREEPSISAVPCSLEELKGLESEIDIGGRKIDGKKENTKIQGVFSKVCQSNDVGNSLEPSLEWTSRNAAQSRDEADEAIRCKQRVDMQQSLEQEPAAFSEKLEVAEGETLYPSDVIKICASTLPKKKKRQVRPLPHGVLQALGDGPLGQAHEDICGPKGCGKFYNGCSQSLSDSQTGPSSKAHMRASVSRVGGLWAKFLGPKKLFFSRKGPRHSFRVKKGWTKVVPLRCSRLTLNLESTSP
ncbi:hypothetical protein Ancab_007929 [Ancistrocladus abbreviatus]